MSPSKAATTSLACNKQDWRQGWPWQADAVAAVVAANNNNNNPADATRHLAVENSARFLAWLQMVGLLDAGTGSHRIDFIPRRSRPTRDPVCAGPAPSLT